MTSFVPALRTFCAIVFAAAAVECAAAAPRLTYSIVAMHAHDASSFTQGLAVVDGKLVESSGGYGRSRISVRDLRVGSLLRERALARDVFAEGLAYDGTRLVQLTWQSGFAQLWSFALKPSGRFAYEGEGWGLAWDGAQWLMSDGSDRVQRRSRDGYVNQGAVRVMDGTRAITRLNELEYARGVLFANIWHSDSIAAVDPGSGRVLGWLDFAALKRGFAKPAGWDSAEHVLNGIAFDPASGHLFVTGKCWPVLYEIALDEWPSAGARPR